MSEEIISMLEGLKEYERKVEHEIREKMERARPEVEEWVRDCVRTDYSRADEVIVDIEEGLVRCWAIHDIRVKKPWKYETEHGRRKCIMVVEHLWCNVCGQSFHPIKAIYYAKPKVSIRKAGNNYIVEGETYQIKEQLKALGGYWDPMRKAWVFRSNPKEKLDAIAEVAEKP